MLIKICDSTGVTGLGSIFFSSSTVSVVTRRCSWSSSSCFLRSLRRGCTLHPTAAYLQGTGSNLHSVGWVGSWQRRIRCVHFLHAIIILGQTSKCVEVRSSKQPFSPQWTQEYDRLGQYKLVWSWWFLYWLFAPQSGHLCSRLGHLDSRWALRFFRKMFIAPQLFFAKDYCVFTVFLLVIIEWSQLSFPTASSAAVHH